MPQSNITYDVPYNQGLVRLLHEMDAKHWQKAGTAYAPSMLGFKLSNFHNDYTDEPSAKMMIGGGSHADQMFLAPGNSPAYPPYMMSSGMLVNSGGALAGIDGAVGGYSFGKFLGDVADVGKHVAKEVGPGLAKDAIKAYMAPAGAGRKKRASKKGGKMDLSKVIEVAEKAQPLAEMVKSAVDKSPMAKAVLDKVSKVAKESVGKGSCGGARGKRADIVKKVMKEKGLKLIEASKYVKAHGLY